MNRKTVANLFLGFSIALLPLYTRVTSLDFNRTSKDNLLLTLLGAACILLPVASRKMNKYMWVSICYGLFFLVYNQWNVLSINVMMQVFYISMGFTFFANYYERHDVDSLHYIYKGMAVGAFIQGVFAISGYLGHEWYFHSLMFVLGIDAKIHTSGAGSINAVGSLGNTNLSASYLCMTIPAFLSFKKKYWLLALVPITGLILTDALMSILPFFAGLVYYWNIEKKILKKWFIYLSASTAMIALPFLPLNIDNGRFLPWKMLMELVDWSHALIGKGAGWFADKKIYVEKSDVYFQQEHNVFLSVFNLYGLIGVLLLLPIFYKFVLSEDKNKIFSTVLFIAFCNGYGHFLGHQSTSVIVALIAACVCLAEGRNNVIDV